MDRYFITGTMALVMTVVSSCISEIPDFSGEKGPVQLTIVAHRETPAGQTRTTREEETGDVFWNPEDEISLFFKQGDGGGFRFVSQNTDTAATAEFRGSIDAVTGGGESLGTGDDYFWGIYPYSINNSCDGTSATLILEPIQTAEAGTFADGLFPTIARSQNVELSFYNICGGIKFSVSQDGIKSVRFKGNNQESLAGKVRVCFDDDGIPVVSEILEGQDEIILNAPDGGTFKTDTYYFIVLLPTTFQNGFTMTFCREDGTEGAYVRESEIKAQRSIFGVLNGKDGEVSEWVESETSVDEEGAESGQGGSESGIYMGITGFNHNLFHYPIGLLNDSTKGGFETFIDNLTSSYGTYLYYSVDCSITKLQEAEFPENLFNVSIITFTDGLDEGSIMMTDYLYDEEYLEAINERISNEPVSDVAIASYTIGLLSDAAKQNQAMFTTNLEKIASSSENVAVVENYDEVNSRLQEIAEQVSRTIQTQNIEINILGKSTGTVFRFTFDGVDDPSLSSLYVEGTFDKATMSLTDVVYYGLTASTGTTVGGIFADGYIKFTFTDILTDSNELIAKNDIRSWYYVASSSSWQISDEGLTEELDPTISREKKSAAILLNLDCSSSIGDDFPTLLEHAKSFIRTLLEASVDPLAVASVSLDKTNETLTVGSVLTLEATIAPATAINKNVTWQSSDADVVSVDESGKVTAIGLGTSTITVTTEDGNRTASCVINVTTPIVTLNKDSLTLAIGNVQTLTASITPAAAFNKNVIWSSSDTSVASVDENGQVTGISIGSAVIVAKAEDGESVDSCIVDVTLSTTPKHLSLAVNKDDVRYYVSAEEYETLSLEGYTREGVAILSSSGYFVLALNDFTLRIQSGGVMTSAGYIPSYKYVTTFTYSSATSYSIPDYSQGQYIADNMAAINNALTSFGGGAMDTSYLYWTSYYSGARYYYFSGDGGLGYDTTGETACHVRKITDI